MGLESLCWVVCSSTCASVHAFAEMFSNWLAVNFSPDVPVLGKFHTLASTGGFSPKLTTYELHELDECKRARQQKEASVSDEDLMEQLKDYEWEVNAYMTLDQTVVTRMQNLFPCLSSSISVHSIAFCYCCSYNFPHIHSR